MSKEYHPVNSKHCCTCIQWEGSREVTPGKGIRADANAEANCLVFHKKVKGHHACDNYFPLR